MLIKGCRNRNLNHGGSIASSFSLRLIKMESAKVVSSVREGKKPAWCDLDSRTEGSAQTFS